MAKYRLQHAKDGQTKAGPMDNNPTESIMSYINMSGDAAEQMLALLTAYGLDFVAAILTLIFGI